MNGLRMLRRKECYDAVPLSGWARYGYHGRLASGCRPVGLRDECARKAGLLEVGKGERGWYYTLLTET